MKFKILAIVILLSSSTNNLLAQEWIYAELNDLETDVVINYDVIYERELTIQEKASKDFIKNKTVTFNKDGMLIEKLSYNDTRINSFKLLDYKKEKLFLCKIFTSGDKGAIINDFKGPSTQVEKKNETKIIAGLEANKGKTIVKGEFKDIYYSKSLGLRYSMNFNVEGFILQYPGYNNALGHYTVIAKTIFYNYVDPEIFSLKGFEIFTKKEYEDRKIESSEKQHILDLKHVGDKIVNFKAHLINDELVSNKTIKGEITLLTFCNFSSPNSFSEKQIPLLNALKEANKGKKINYIAVALDEEFKLNNFLKEHPLHFDIIPNGRWLAEKFEVSNYPTNVLINENGIIKLFEVGYKSDAVDRLNYEINKL